MNKLFHVIAWGALAWLTAVAFGCFLGRIAVDAAKTHFLATTVAWFVAAPLAARRPR